MASPSHKPQTPEQVLRRLEWTALRRLDGLLHGDYRTLWRGAGLDLADLREYQLHDDVRHIDWNVTARLQQPYVRQYHEDRDLTAWFLLDLSGSIDFGSRETAKRTLSGEFVALLARVLTRHGNRVGALMYGTDVDTVLPARGGRGQVLQILHRMTSRPIPAVRKGTDLAVLLHGAAETIRRRSLIFVVSDFISTPGWADPLGRLAQRHEVVAVRLFDPLELQLPDLGLVVIEDAETGEQLFVDTHDVAFRRRFEQQAAAREAALRDAFTRAGVDALELSTDGELVEAIVRFVEMRRLRQRTSGAAARLPSHLAPAGAAR